MNKSKEEKLRLGKVVNTVGLKGELRIYPYTDDKKDFEEIPYVLIDEKRYDIEKVRYVKNMAVIKLSGLGNQEEAEKLKDKEVFLLRKDAPALPEDTYYVKDLLGLKVIDDGGQVIGFLKEVVIGAAQDIYMVERKDSSKTFPVPAVAEFVKAIDLEKGTIRVKLIEGLTEL